MPLRLEIISHQRTRLGERRQKEFGVKGGTIGRSLESDWALEDSQRYLSGRHAAIDFRSGSYYIVDTSTNGVYVNDSRTPIGRAKPQRLFHGDRLRLGDYVMLVHLEESDAEHHFETGEHIDPVDKAQKIESPAPTGYTLLSEDELSMLAVEEILADDSAADALKAAAVHAASGLRLVDDEPSTAKQRKPRPLPERVKARKPAAQRPAAAKPAPEAEIPAPEAAKPAPKPAAGRSPKQAVSAASAGDAARTPAAKQPATTDGTPDALTAQTALYTFMRGAGLSPRELPPKEAAMLLHRAGQLLREVAVGLRTAIDNRVEQKNVLRLANTTIQPKNNNMLKFSASVDEALENLFFNQKPEYLPAIESVRETFAEAAAHEYALLEATHTALLDYLERFDPEDIQQKCEDGGKRGLLAGIGDSRFRNWYKELYATLAEHSPGHFPQQFGEVFATAYEREVSARLDSNDDKPPRAESGSS